MAYKNLRHFIQALENSGELARINAMVSAHLEITEIADRVSKQHGKALLMQRVEGSSYPILINAMGSYRRMALALGSTSLDEIGTEIAAYLNLSQYTTLRGLLSCLPRLIRLLACFPWKMGLPLGKAPCQQVVEKSPDLSTLPVLQCWPQDGGRFFTLPLVVTRHPDTRQQNVGMYRMQVLDKTTTAMHWHKHKDGSALYSAWQKHGARMPVAVVLGGDPAITYAATAPLPPGIDEMMLAGFLRKSPVKLTKCVTCDLWVPRDAEFVLEGYVDPKEELVWEGPFGDHTGYYSLEDWYPRFHVTCITHRKDAIYPATVVGKPPMEDCYMAKATERIFLPILKMGIPQLADLNLPLEGVFHNCAIVAVKNDFPGAARTVMNAIWGMGQMRYTKLIIAVDEALDLQSWDAVLSAMLCNTEPTEDLVFSCGPLDALDHSSNQAFYGTRLGVDATTKKRPVRQPGRIAVIPVKKVAAWEGMRAAKEALKDRDVQLAVAVDYSVDPSDHSTVLWRIFNNIDASRDLIVYHGRVALDATKKWPEEGLTRPWPDDIIMSPEIVKKVSQRWREYGI